jgi:hypothetical protein
MLQEMCNRGARRPSKKLVCKSFQNSAQASWVILEQLCRINSCKSLRAPIFHFSYDMRRPIRTDTWVTASLDAPRASLRAVDPVVLEPEALSVSAYIESQNIEEDLRVTRVGTAVTARERGPHTSCRNPP